jgi:limonene-1,2-epoxide hydrolase
VATEKYILMKQIIDEFYTAFQNLDAEKMVSFYHSQVEFEDPAFGKLKGERAKNMWRMLCKSSKDLEINFSSIQANDENGSASWEAHYNFSKTGRKVHNIISAEFKFKDGKIIEHRDNFSLYRWSLQAFGLKGLILGWTPFF